MPVKSIQIISSLLLLSLFKNFIKNLVKCNIKTCICKSFWIPIHAHFKAFHEVASTWFFPNLLFGKRNPQGACYLFQNIKINLIKQPLYQSHILPAPNIQNTSSGLLSSLFPLPPERDKTHRTPPHPYEGSACMTHTPSDFSLKMTG